MTAQRDKPLAQAGDWLEARSIGGGAPRRGQITRVLGTDGHRRYLVRWDEQHESIVYPADGVSILAFDDVLPDGGRARPGRR